MGIKGRRKKLRQREEATRDAMAGGEDMAGPNVIVMGDGPFQCPTNAAGELRIKKSELYKLNDLEYLEQAKEEHTNRRKSHLSRKRERDDDDIEEKAAQVEEELLGHTFDDPAALDELLEKELQAAQVSGKGSSLATGPRFSHPLMGLNVSLVAALEGCGWNHMTRIQERTIPYALQGFDILGQARTGSGKTLAFCIPVLETAMASLGSIGRRTTGLILAPTKELCVQTESIIDKVLSCLPKSILTVSLITGGTNASEERGRLTAGVSIVVGTPGRIHDHGKHCSGWDLSALRCFVLDEADRMLADGFQRDLTAIHSFLPPAPQRQTFLFSATNSKSVRELARLSLSRTPIFISTSGTAPQPIEVTDQTGGVMVALNTTSVVPYQNYVNASDDDEEEGTSRQEEDREAIPATLKQFCQIVPLRDRLLRLYSFVRRVAKTSKAMVFCSTVASTTFHYQMMTSVGFHDTVMMLHGHMKHRQRVQAFKVFNEWETGVLFCTDVAARGLDISEVEWILQYDPPLDPTEYIHRIGRTARAGRAGNALLFLTPNEVQFVRYLHKFNIRLEKYPEPVQLPPIQEKLEHVLQLDPVVAKSAVAAYRAHVGAYQSHILQETFNVHHLDLQELAIAFALTAAPQVTLPKDSQASKQEEYVKGKLKSLSRRKKESLRHYEAVKTKQQWEGSTFIGMHRPSSSLL